MQVITRLPEIQERNRPAESLGACCCDCFVCNIRFTSFFVRGRRQGRQPLNIYTDYMCIIYIYILCNVYYIYNGRRQPWILNEGNPRIKLPNLDSDMPRLLPVAQLFAEFHRICVGRPAPEALSQLQSSLPV